jgi:hypothetical protein
MKSTCVIKERKRLVQVECKWCDKFSRENFKHKLYMTCNLWEEAPLPSTTLWFFAWVTSKWHFFLGFPNESPKIGTLIVPKLWMLISSSNQAYLEHEIKEISYSPQKYLSNGVSHALIGDHLTLAIRGFMVGSQIPNLTPCPSFDHNSCILSLNEQCEGTLGMYILRTFQWYP